MIGNLSDYAAFARTQKKREINEFGIFTPSLPTSPQDLVLTSHALYFQYDATSVLFSWCMATMVQPLGSLTWYPSYVSYTVIRFFSSLGRQLFGILFGCMCASFFFAWCRSNSFFFISPG